ncbi:hypothetical protein HPB50_027335 [Hyalomma asiaticum]|uniref:Uncharacterized protein n=1 Tax=Hyalomma asiaticum TaxID=266040 RepID=A0ACB7T6U7_HYAAI|nr:hypothetical protein HPB50_027335 [Hyalomma asiaticum]
MVNIFPVIDRAVKNCMAIWNELIPEKVTVRTIEAVKVLEDELLSSFDESAAYAMRREDTTALVKAHFSIADEAVVENLQVRLSCWSVLYTRRALF